MLPSERVPYEHMTADIPRRGLDAELRVLDEHGDEGWQLAAVLDVDIPVAGLVVSYRRFYFRRPR